MTVNEACELFGKDKREIYQCLKEKMVPKARKVKNKWIIPDGTKIIPSKMDIQCFLLEVLKFKNNPKVVVSRSLFPDEESLKILLEYVYNKGLIGEYSLSSFEVSQALSSIKMTEQGFDWLLGKSNQTLSSHQISIFQINVTNNFQAGLVNLSV